MVKFTSDAWMGDREGCHEIIHRKEKYSLTDLHPTAAEHHVEVLEATDQDAFVGMYTAVISTADGDIEQVWVVIAVKLHLGQVSGGEKRGLSVMGVLLSSPEKVYLLFVLL